MLKLLILEFNQTIVNAWHTYCYMQTFTVHSPPLQESSTKTVNVVGNIKYYQQHLHSFRTRKWIEVKKINK